MFCIPFDQSSGTVPLIIRLTFEKLQGYIIDLKYKLCFNLYHFVIVYFVSISAFYRLLYNDTHVFFSNCFHRFDQLYPLVEDVFYKELLLLELKEQLYSATTQHEETEILQVLQATGEYGVVQKMYTFP